MFGRLVWPQVPSGWVRKISTPQGFDLRTVRPLASRYNDYTFKASQALSKLTQSCLIMRWSHKPSLSLTFTVYRSCFWPILKNQYRECHYHLTASYVWFLWLRVFRNRRVRIVMFKTREIVRLHDRWNNYVCVIYNITHIQEVTKEQYKHCVIQSCWFTGLVRVISPNIRFWIVELTVLYPNNQSFLLPTDT